MKQALKELIHEMEYVLSCINADKVPFDGDDFHEALRLGKEALAQPEQEPVRIMGFDCVCGRRMEVSAEQGVEPSPQRTWIGLTEEDMDWLHANTPCIEGNYGYRFIKAIEAKLKEKNT